MYDEDVEVLSAVAIPTGKIRDVYGEVEDNHDPSPASMTSSEKTNLFLLGIALTAIICLSIVLYFYLRLRQEHALYEKDKVQLSAGSKVLHNILNKMVSPSPSSSQHQHRQSPTVGGNRSGPRSSSIEESSLLRGDVDE